MWNLCAGKFPLSLLGTSGEYWPLWQAGLGSMICLLLFLWKIPFAIKTVLVLSGGYDQMQNYCRSHWHREPSTGAHRSPLCLLCLEILEKIFWHKFIVKHQFWSGNPSFQRSELTSNSSSGLKLVNKNIAMGLMAKQFFQNQLQAQMLSELFPLEQWEFWWAWRSGLTASPRQPAHRKASESFSLMREPQMSNRKNNQVRISSCLFSPVCTHLWFPGQ